MKSRPRRYYVIRDQLDRWHGLYQRLRDAGRYWLADRLRNAANQAGVGVAGGVWYDEDELKKEREWIGFVNTLIAPTRRPLLKAPGVNDYVLITDKGSKDE